MLQSKVPAFCSAIYLQEFLWHPKKANSPFGKWCPVIDHAHHSSPVSLQVFRRNHLFCKPIKYFDFPNVPQSLKY